MSKGLAVQIDVHAPHGADGESERANFHAHLLITTRRVEGEGFALKKARDLDPQVRASKGRAVVSEAEAWGATWRDHQNRYFIEHGLDLRVDVTSAVPQEHIGPVRMRAADAPINQRAEEIRKANELAARDPEQVLGVLTRNNATFTRRDVDRHLEKHIADGAVRAEVRGQVLGSVEVLGLHHGDSGEVAERFTTRSVREQELEALADGERVAAGSHEGLGGMARLSARGHSSLRADQMAAFLHATGPGGLKIVEGRAGTGKSFTLGAIRDAHAAAGYDVVGLAPTNAVAQDMKADGFSRSSTVHAELFRLKNGHAQWGRRTLVVVDEAAMMDSKVTGAVLREAKLAGAKVVLAGDDRQLASIERGGLFGELRKAHGSSEITEVTRQKVDWQREAARDLSEGRFESALRGFARNKAVVWTARQDDSRAALVEQWKQDTRAAPRASRFVFAYTNKDVDTLNEDLRAVRRERGELGVDHKFTTKHGLAAFAVGDRVQFTDTLKGDGIYNGNAGIITGIDGRTSRITARLDAAAGREGRKVEWSASEFQGFRHGYAGTIYKGQGKTLDHTYLLHSKHWRATSSYVALTRQRESAKVFVAVETARDIKELARQIGRAEIKSASVAYKTFDELRPEQQAKARVRQQESLAREKAEATRLVGIERPEVGAASVKPLAGPEAATAKADKIDGAAIREANPEAIMERSLARKAGQDVGAAASAGEGGAPSASVPASAATSAPREFLIPAFEGRGPDGSVRDSLGRGLAEKSLAAVVASDERVQRELRDRAIYIQSAYRDPKHATARLDDLLALDGAVSAARRVTAEPGLLGELLGREGAWVGAKARAERRNAIEVAAAIGPNLTRTVVAEAQAVKTYRLSVEAQIAADRTPIPKMSERAVAALGAISGARTDEDRAAAVKAFDAEPEIKRDVEAFRKAVEKP